MQKRYNYLANENGIGLVMVMMLLVVISLLAITILSVSAGQLTLATKDRSFHSSFYLAEAGLNKTVAEIYDQVDHLYALSPNEGTFFQQLDNAIMKDHELVDLSFSKQYRNDPEVNVSVSRISDENPRTYVIESVGSVNGSKRTVKTNMEVRWDKSTSIEIPDNLVAYTGILSSKQCETPQAKFAEGAQLNGDYGTSCISEGAVEFTGGSSLNGNTIYIPTEADDSIIKRNNYHNEIPPLSTNNHVLAVESIRQLFEEFPTIPSYATPDNETIGDQYNHHQVIENGNINITHYQADNYILELNNNASFQDINVSGNRRLYIDTNGVDREITVDDLNLSNGHISISNGRQLTVYVQGSITFGSGSTFNADGASEDLHIILAGANKHFTLAGAQKVNGHIFAEDASITLTASGGFDGSIITGGSKVELSGGTYNESLILAPYAEVLATVGSEVFGTIISDRLTVSGGATFTYRKVDVDHLPVPNHSGSDNVPEDAYKKGQTLEKD
ncbi:DUF7305 domain-containing protein [Gracilibacillus thailandensis]|uniref:DUF7305 domain-containing protein n=1 Tax=Gracilibacillus thailandensis TaxID=563735 RepID=A0A6N7QZL8_9BACI|nr:hypothetical protein [Gracilibacillus thailandensis]MRI67593.1 hypothetical protein [Gracilibacillus thailandensis]